MGFWEQLLIELIRLIIAILLSHLSFWFSLFYFLP